MSGTGLQNKLYSMTSAWIKITAHCGWGDPRPALVSGDCVVTHKLGVLQLLYHLFIYQCITCYEIY